MRLPRFRLPSGARCEASQPPGEGGNNGLKASLPLNLQLRNWQRPEMNPIPLRMTPGS